MKSKTICRTSVEEISLDYDERGVFVLRHRKPRRAEPVVSVWTFQEAEEIADYIRSQLNLACPRCKADKLSREFTSGKRSAYSVLLGGPV